MCGRLAELGEGRTERAARLFALAERGYGQTRSPPWRPEAEIHRRVESDLRALMSARYDEFMTEARQVDFDIAITDLVAGQPSGVSP